MRATEGSGTRKEPIPAPFCSPAWRPPTYNRPHGGFMPSGAPTFMNMARSYNREQGSLLQLLCHDVAHPTGVGVADFGRPVDAIAFIGLFIGAFPVDRHLFKTGLFQ